METYHENVLKEQNTALHFPNFKNGDGVRKLVGSMPDDLALGEWDLHTLQDMIWNDNQQCPVKYWSQDIIKNMRWLMRQPVYAEQPIDAPQRSYNSDMPPRGL